MNAKMIPAMLTLTVQITTALTHVLATMATRATGQTAQVK